MLKLSIIVQQIPQKDQNQLCISLWFSPVVSGKHWGTRAFSSFQNENSCTILFSFNEAQTVHLLGTLWIYFGFTLGLIIIWRFWICLGQQDDGHGSLWHLKVFLKYLNLSLRKQEEYLVGSSFGKVLLILWVYLTKRNLLNMPRFINICLVFFIYLNDVKSSCLHFPLQLLVYCLANNIIQLISLIIIVVLVLLFLYLNCVFMFQVLHGISATILTVKLNSDLVFECLLRNFW